MNTGKWKILYIYSIALYSKCDIIVVSKEIFVINSKRKGKVGELEVVNLLKEKGLTARRTQQFSGKADGTSDVLCEELNNFHIEVKRDEHLNIEKALQQSIRDSEKENTIPTVFHRKNKEEWKVTMRLEDWLNLVQNK